jgi:hypothetical protein
MALARYSPAISAYYATYSFRCSYSSGVALVIVSFRCLTSSWLFLASGNEPSITNYPLSLVARSCWG